jgi:hypothetical protein
MFFYTGSKSGGESRAEESLGGFVSSSQVKNESEGIFKNNDLDISHRLIAFKNGDGRSEPRVMKISVEQDLESEYEIKISLAMARKNVCGEDFFEQIPTPASSPLFSDFKDSLIVPDIELVMGIWIKKYLKENKVEKKFKQFVEFEELEKIINFSKKEDVFSLKFLMLQL